MDYWGNPIFTEEELIENKKQNLLTSLEQIQQGINTDTNIDLINSYENQDVHLLRPVFLDFISKWNGTYESISSILTGGEVFGKFFPNDYQSQYQEHISLLSSDNKIIRCLSYENILSRVVYEEFKMFWENLIERDSDHWIGVNEHLYDLDYLIEIYKEYHSSKSPQCHAKLFKMTEIILESSLDPTGSVPTESCYFTFITKHLHLYLSGDDILQLCPKFIQFFTNSIKGVSLHVIFILSSIQLFEILRKNYSVIYQQIEDSFKNTLKGLLSVDILEENGSLNHTIGLIYVLRANQKILKPFEKEIVLKVINRMVEIEFENHISNKVFLLYKKHLNEAQLLKLFNMMVASGNHRKLDFFDNLEIKDFIPNSRIQELLKDCAINQKEKKFALYVCYYSSSSEKKKEKLKELQEKFDMKKVIEFEYKKCIDNFSSWKRYYNHALILYKETSDFSNMIQILTMKNDSRTKIGKILLCFYENYREQTIKYYKSNGYKVFNDHLLSFISELNAFVKTKYFTTYLKCMNYHIEFLEKEMQMPKKKVKEVLNSIFKAFQKNLTGNTIFINCDISYSFISYINLFMVLQKENSIWLEFFNFNSLKPILSKYGFSVVPSMWVSYEPLENELVKCHAEILATYYQDQKNFDEIDDFHKRLLSSFSMTISEYSYRSSYYIVRYENRCVLEYANFDLSFKTQLLKKLIHSHQYGDLTPINFIAMIEIFKKDKIVFDNLQNILHIIDNPKSFLILFQSFPNYQYWINNKQFQRIFFNLPNSIKSKIYKEFQDNSNNRDMENNEFKLLNINNNINSLENFLNPIENSKVVPHYLLKLVIEKIYQDFSVPSSQKVSFSFISKSFFYYCSDLINVKNYPIEMKSRLLKDDDFKSEYCLLKKPPKILKSRYIDAIPLCQFNSTLENLEYLKVHNEYSPSPFEYHCRNLKFLRADLLHNQEILDVIEMVKNNLKTLEYVEIYESCCPFTQMQPYEDFTNAIQELRENKKLKSNFTAKYVPCINYLTTLPPNLHSVKHIALDINTILSTGHFKVLFGEHSDFSFESLRITLTKAFVPIKSILEMLTILSDNKTLKSLVIKYYFKDLNSIETLQIRSNNSLNQIFKQLNNNKSITTFKYYYQLHHRNQVHFNSTKNELMIDSSKIDLGEFYLSCENSFKKFKRLLKIT